MDPIPRNPPSPPPAGSSAQRAMPRPTSGRENGGLMYFFIGAAVLALLLVAGFNVLGPDGASRTGIGDGPAQSSAGPTTGGPDASSDTTAGTQRSTPGQGSTAGTTTSRPPQAADTPNPVGREAVGAPMGGAPTAGPGRTQGVSADGTTTGDTPAAEVQPGASAMPAAPPASR
jgi:hypothetical protein